MVRISFTNGQARITIPKEIILLTKWNENTDLIFIPQSSSPFDTLTPETLVILKKIPKSNDSGDIDDHE